MFCSESLNDFISTKKTHQWDSVDWIWEGKQLYSIVSVWNDAASIHVCDRYMVWLPYFGDRSLNCRCRILWLKMHVRLPSMQHYIRRNMDKLFSTIPAMSLFNTYFIASQLRLNIIHLYVLLASLYLGKQWSWPFYGEESSSRSRPPP